MNDDLNNLKEKMNETVFQDIRFDEKHRQNVLKEIKKSKKRVEWKPKVNHLINIAATVVLVLGAGYFAINYLVNAPQYQQNADSIFAEDKSTAPQPNAENYDDMTKAEIMDLIQNSEKHFETARGSFVYIYLNGVYKRKVDYAINLNEDHNYGGYSKEEESTDQAGSDSIYRYYNEDTLWVLQENTRTYVESSYLTHDEAKKEGDLSWNPPIGFAGIPLFPENEPSGNLLNPENWEIEKQNEVIQGHNTIVLKGYPDQFGYSHRFWIDKDTGILVKYREYDKEDNVTMELETISLEVNVPIDSEEISPPDFEELGYKKS